MILVSAYLCLNSAITSQKLIEPRVDVQARNLAEGQADVAIRGGVFENTGFKFGAFSVYDPQTGDETHDSTLTLVSPDTLKVEGCRLVLCRSETWTRVR